MKRKIAKIGPSSLMVSLPSKWVKINNLKKGDELDVLEEGKKLVMSTGNEIKFQHISLDARGIPHLLYRVIGALYKAGYDEIEIEYNSPQELSIIQSVLRTTCIGFELMNQSKNRIVIRSISKPDVKEFEVVFRRCFLSLLNIAEESLESIKKLDKSGLEMAILSDDNINRLSDFCRRVINKGVNISSRAPAVYCLAEQLEKIGDMYKDLNKFLCKDMFKLSRNTEQIYLRVNQFLRLFYEIHYDFNLTKMDKFVAEGKEIKVEIEKELQMVSKKEMFVLFHIYNIASSTFDLNGALMTARI